ncbi:MAG TPA: penicillin-binding transpeptidase domain-containing protein [Chlamydiales bacterium]|nr:penicillin-binding transpeptidase domain-containing protein [Chlamydiales bacterium]
MVILYNLVSNCAMHSNRMNQILAIIFAACLAICFRSFHLAVIQKEVKLIEAQKPQSRTILQRANRGTVCDRFGIPLAINRICYNAVIYYGQISQIPSSQYKGGPDGKRVRVFPRKEYIKSFSQMLGAILEESPGRIEDLILSKASLFPHAPYLLRAKLTEKQYYRLKGLEKDWPGLHAEIGSERFYPMNKTACHILGTMGVISQQKYDRIAEELSILQESVLAYEQGMASSLPKGCGTFEAACIRLRELKEKAYTLSDFVGNSGIEAQFEEQLRGFYGKKIFEVDQKGRSVRERAGSKPPVPGNQVVLSISAELQQFAEELLIANEKVRDGRSYWVDPIDKKRKPLRQPWIKGGAIVAIDPNNGEVLALASLPRFNPNDFIRPSSSLQLSRWLESETYLGAIWDGVAALVRERFDKELREEELAVGWEEYLDFTLPKEGPLRSFFQKCDCIKNAIQVQEDFETVRYFSKISDPLRVLKELFGSQPKGIDAEGAQSVKRLEAFLEAIPAHSDKLFAIDLCRVCIDSTRFSDALIAKIGSMKLKTYRELSALFLKLQAKVKEEEFARFKAQEFCIWRQMHQKTFLEEKRREEKERKRYARPYLDYLDQKAKELFSEWWSAKKWQILREKIANEPKLLAAVKDLSIDLAEEFFHTFRSFQELDRPLLGPFQKIRTEKDLAASFYPKEGFGYLRSYAFQTSAPQGSLFKLVTAYEGLRQGHCPWIIDDASKDRKIVAYAANDTFYPRMYKGGRLPRSSILQIGRIDIAGALEQTSNPYFSILAGDYLSDPEDLKKAALQLGYGTKTGLDLPGENAGLLPNDLKTNRTSLYSFAFGQHTLLSTPLQTGIMLSALADGGKVKKPKIAIRFSGLSPDRKMLSAFDVKNGFVEKELKTLGIPFSLFTGVETKRPVEETGVLPSVVIRTIPFSASIRSQLFEGMDRVMWSPKGTARPEIIRLLRSSRELLAEHLAFRHQVIGKTSSAEILYRPDVNPSGKAHIVKHTWFGTIAFLPSKIRYDHPELVVIVFLRFGDAGKEAAPLAVQMVKKWREIKKKYKLYINQSLS